MERECLSLSSDLRWWQDHGDQDQLEPNHHLTTTTTMEIDTSRLLLGAAAMRDGVSCEGMVLAAAAFWSASRE